MENKAFRSKVRSWYKSKGREAVKYLKEFIEDHHNPTALGISGLPKKSMVNIINGVLSDKEDEARVKHRK